MYIKGGFYAQAVAEIGRHSRRRGSTGLAGNARCGACSERAAAQAGEICNLVLLSSLHRGQPDQAQILWRVSRKPERRGLHRLSARSVSRRAPHR
jgi:hypothetical protein